MRQYAKKKKKFEEKNEELPARLNYWIIVKIFATSNASFRVPGWKSCERNVSFLFGWERAIKTKFFRTILSFGCENKKIFLRDEKKMSKTFTKKPIDERPKVFEKNENEIMKSATSD